LQDRRPTAFRRELTGAVARLNIIRASLDFAQGWEAAVPKSTEGGQRAFCEDESGRIRYAEDGEAAGCLSAGEPLP